MSDASMTVDARISSCSSTSGLTEPTPMFRSRMPRASSSCSGTVAQTSCIEHGGVSKICWQECSAVSNGLVQDKRLANVFYLGNGAAEVEGF
jgi:hypothetical protein